MKSQQNISRSAVYGKNGAVAAARESSVAAAIDMLDRGGNAVDAGVAAAFVAGVVEPMETTLAGSGFLLLSMPDGVVHSMEFGPRAPMRAHEGMFQIDGSRLLDRGLGVSTVVNDENVQGASAAGVPATLAGLTAAHARYGKLPLATVLSPAIEAAFEGFSADPYFALEALDNLAALRNDKGASQLFLRDGLPPASAHLGAATLGQPVLIQQKALGSTLEQIAALGADAFYSGSLGESFLQTHHELGGLLSREDLLGVRPKFTVPRRLRFRDCDIWTPAAPCGAVTQLQILNIWQALHSDELLTDDTPQRLEHLAKASWHAFADRYHWLGDPDFVSVPDQGLLSAEYARYIAENIMAGHPAPRSVSLSETPWNYFARHAAHDPWAYQENQAEKVQWSPLGSTEPTAGTTHVSVTDEHGMAVSITHTAANHCGAKVVCERTGLLFDAAMGWFNARPNAANSIAGGKRPLANMGPVMLTRQGRTLAAVGAPGGRRIINAVVQVVLNLVERRMNAEEALAAPRIDASGTALLVSERLEPIVKKMSELSGETKLVSEQHQGYGYELARPVIAMHDDQFAYAAVDPYSKGYARSRQ
ncbi:MAG TPA: gamma-glutamyltransferase [Candidimonas sp.]|nr:gamma-glutamyltransferase [Candidimonas sp.]